MNAGTCDGARKLWEACEPVAAAPAAAVAVQAAAWQVAALVAGLGAAVTHLRRPWQPMRTAYAQKCALARLQMSPMQRTLGTCWTGRKSATPVHGLAAHDLRWVSSQRHCSRGAVCGGSAR